MNAFEWLLIAFLYKILEKNLWNSFLLFLLVEILKLVHEISNFAEVLFKRGVLRNFSKFTGKHKRQSSGGVLSKDVLKNYAKFIEKYLYRSLFLHKVPDWKPEAATRDVLQKKVFLKILEI